MALQIDDIVGKIFTFVDWGSTFKAVLFTCKKWNSLIRITHSKGHIIFANHLLTLLKLYPNAPWDYDWLSANPNITWEYIENNPDKPWDYYWLSINPNITWEIVRKYPNKSWSHHRLSKNPSITYADVIASASFEEIKILWEYNCLSCNTSLTWEDILQHVTKPWNYFELSQISRFAR